MGVDLAVFDVASYPMQCAMVEVHFFRTCFISIIFFFCNWASDHLAP